MFYTNESVHTYIYLLVFSSDDDYEYRVSVRYVISSNVPNMTITVEPIHTNDLMGSFFLVKY